MTKGTGTPRTFCAETKVLRTHTLTKTRKVLRRRSARNKGTPPALRQRHGYSANFPPGQRYSARSPQDQGTPPATHQRQRYSARSPPETKVLCTVSARDTGTAPALHQRQRYSTRFPPERKVLRALPANDKNNSVRSPPETTVLRAVSAKERRYSVCSPPETDVLRTASARETGTPPALHQRHGKQTTVWALLHTRAFQKKQICVSTDHLQPSSQSGFQ